MKTFERTDDYNTKIFLDALDGDVRLDAEVTFYGQGRKLKAYCAETRTNLQFPTKLRSRYKTYIADVVKCERKDGAVFYRAYKGSIRDSKTGEVVG